jgi:hypothetical protein
MVGGCRRSDQGSDGDEADHDVEARRLGRSPQDPRQQRPPPAATLGKYRQNGISDQEQTGQPLLRRLRAKTTRIAANPN